MPKIPASIHKMRDTSATTAHWTMGEGAGTTVQDSTGLGHTGTLDGGTVWATTGRLQNTLSFPGTNGNHLTIANAADLQPANITIMFWGMIEANGSYPMWCTCFSAPYQTGYELRCSAATRRLEWLVGTGGGNSGPSDPASLSLNTWYFIAAVADGTNAILYKDGVQVGSAAAGAIVANANPTWLGDRSVAGGNPLTGRIDDFQIRNVAMTAAQIKAEFELLSYATCYA